MFGLFYFYSDSMITDLDYSPPLGNATFIGDCLLASLVATESYNILVNRFDWMVTLLDYCVLVPAVSYFSSFLKVWNDFLLAPTQATPIKIS